MTKSGDCKNSKETKKTPKKAESHRKVTHLYLNDKFLSSIGKLSGYGNLTVLYLHNNAIYKIQKLDNLPNLRSLYLQRNKIAKIENLDRLVKLQRLYLSHNEISVVENLENLKYLEELHIEKQNLATGDKLCFDPRSIKSLSESLEILNVSNNNLSTIQMLAPLKYLRILYASNNNINSIQNIADTVKQLIYLQETSFIGNPVAKEHRYKETIIGKSNSLKTLDAKEITDVTRSFIKRFEIEKNNFESKDVARLPKNISNVAKNYPPPLQKAVSNFMLKPTKPLDNPALLSSASDAYIPWKCMPSSFSDANTKVPPLLRKQKKRTESRSLNLSNLPSLL